MKDLWTAASPGGRLPIYLVAALAALTLLPLTGASAAGAQTAPASGELPPIPGAESLPDVVARVDGEPINKRELLARAQTMRFQAAQAGGGDPGQSPQYLVLVLDALINERLVYADAQSREVGPSEVEIEQRLQASIEAMGGEAEFAKRLATHGLDRQYLRRQVTQNLSFEKVMEVEIQPEIQVSEEAVQTFYDRVQDQLRVPAYYKVRHIMKQVPQNAGFEAREAARSQLEALRQQVVGGADLAALAREHSDDARTREQGGEMPWIVLTGRGGDFEPAVAQLEVGELSGVVETPVGLHLIRLEDFKPERNQTLDEARDEIVNRLAALEAREEIQRRIDRLRASAKVEILIEEPAVE